jgi:hypothetical protein
VSDTAEIARRLNTRDRTDGIKRRMTLSTDVAIDATVAVPRTSLGGPTVTGDSNGGAAVSEPT